MSRKVRVKSGPFFCHFLKGSLNLPAWMGGRGGVELARGRYGFQIERSALPLSLSLSLAGGLVGTLDCEGSTLQVVWAMRSISIVNSENIIGSVYTTGTVGKHCGQ